MKRRTLLALAALSSVAVALGLKAAPKPKFRRLLRLIASTPCEEHWREIEWESVRKGDIVRVSNAQHNGWEDKSFRAASDFEPCAHETFAKTPCDAPAGCRCGGGFMVEPTSRGEAVS